MKKRLIGLLAAGLLLLSGVAWAEPKIPPPPQFDIYAQDYAGIMSRDSKSRINRLSAELQSKTGAQVVVVTIPSLEDSTISEYSLALFRKWGIGDRKLNNGVLLLYAAAEKKTRIEVGYGLEGALPDAKAGRILDEVVLPFFTNEDYNSGLMNGYLAIVSEVSKEYGDPLKAQTKTSPKKRISTGASWFDGLPWWVQWAIIGIVILFFLFDWIFLGGFFTSLIFALASFGGGGGRGGGGFGGGSGGGGGAER